VTTPPNGRGKAGQAPTLAAFDLDAAMAAAEAEAGPPVPFAFTWKGERYEIPGVNEWPLDVLDMITAGDLGPGMAALLGEENYARLKASGLTLGAMNRIFDQVSTVAGFGGLPNSPPPTGRGTTRR
jgi:hypothetical protein